MKSPRGKTAKSRILRVSKPTLTQLTARANQAGLYVALFTRVTEGWPEVHTDINTRSQTIDHVLQNPDTKKLFCTCSEFATTGACLHIRKAQTWMNDPKNGWRTTASAPPPPRSEADALRTALNRAQHDYSRGFRTEALNQIAYVLRTLIKKLYP